MKNKIRRIMSFMLIFAIMLGTFTSNTLIVNAATTSTVSLSGMGSHGTMSIGGKTKSGTWWKMHVGGKEAFCLSLGATCHAGNTYEVTEKCNWTQDTGGEKRGYYAKIFKWYVVNCKRSKKSFIMSQALLWSASEGHTSAKQFKDVIKQVKDNTGYYSSKSVDDLYKTIFETTDKFEVSATYWKKSGGTKGYQTLLTVDADVNDLYNPKHLSKSTYYRQRVNVQKSDELNNPLGGIKFQLDVHNIDEFYSFSVDDANGVDSSNVDSSDDTEFSMNGVTKADGTIAYRMTYYLQSYNEVYYYTDEDLKDMSADDKKAAKKHLKEDLELEEGVDFGSGMTKNEAQEIANYQVAEQLKVINNAYTLTETDTSAQPAVVADPTFANGYAFTLGTDSSWTKNNDGKWPDSLLDVPQSYSLAYNVGVTNKYKKATVNVIKKDSYSNDGNEHGEASLDGAKFQLYGNAECTVKATVYDESGNPFEAGEYTTKEKSFETDFLMPGVTYYLKEIEPPKGYVINDEVKPLSVDGGALTAEFTHKAINQEVTEAPVLGKIAIQKYFDEDDPNELNPEPGAKFQIYLKKAGSFDNSNADYERDELVTDDKGYACSKDLYCGTYIVHQVDSGPVDTLNVDDFEVEVTENGKVYTYPLRNQYFKSFLKILKMDKNTNKQVLKEGTAYQIYKVLPDGTQEKVVQKNINGDKETEVDTFITDKSGEIMTYEELKSATYRIYEVESASGLHITDEYVEVTINSKLANYTEEVDENGYKHVTVTVTYSNEETNGRFILKKTGEQLVRFDTEKKEFVFEEKNLTGVEFEIYANEDIKTQDNQGDNWFKKGDLIATIVTGKDVKFTKDIKDLTGYELDKDGNLTINLPLGKYTVKEKKTLYGYVFPKDTKWELEFNWKNSKDTFVLNTTSATDENGVLAVKNSLANTKVKLVKTDDLTSTGIAGATFGLFTKNDIYNAAGEKIVDAGTKLTEITTDASGCATCDLKVPVMDEKYKEPNNTNLNSGDYYLKELSVTDSYYLNDTEIPVHFEYKDAATDTLYIEVSKTNTETFTEIDKLSIAGSEEIAGCKLKITDTDGNEVVSWISGDKDSVVLNESLKTLGYENVWTEMTDKGNLMIHGLLHDKEYIFSETRPADGYVTADDIHFMVKKNPNVATVTPDTSGGATSSKVYGDDSIIAVKNAEGVFEDKEDAKVIMYDDVTNIRLLKIAGDNGQGLAGAKFVVLDKDGNEIAKFTTTDEGYEFIGKLTVGETYTFKETSAPKGYKIAKAVKYTIKDTSEWQTIEIKDKKIPNMPHIPQTSGGTFPVIMLGLYLAMIAIVVFRFKSLKKTKE